MKDVHLLPPEERFESSYLEAIAEFIEEGLAEGHALTPTTGDFSEYLQRLRKAELKEHCKPGRVPETTLWLVDGERFIGRVGIRHYLTELLESFGGHIGYAIRPLCWRQGYGTQALRLALPEARKLGIARVLVTCAAGNIGSRKIIEANGGILENEVDIPERTGKTRRYWISI